VSFKKFQLINPNSIGSPEDGHVYLGRDEIGLWEKYSNGEWVYVITGSTTGAGTSGSSGVNGIDGEFLGSSGTSGTSGSSGSNGTSGSSGKTGTSGTSGLGSSGTSGLGSSGTSGLTGSSGTSGNGTSGSSGKDGNFFGSSGLSGSSGISSYGGSSRRWIYSTNSVPIENGQFTTDNLDLSSLNYIRIYSVDADEQFVGNWINSWSFGVLKIEKWGNSSIFGIYLINSGITYTSGYYEINNLTLYNGYNLLSNNDDYIISFVPGGLGTGGSGDSGSSGTSGEGSPGSSGTSGEGSPGTSGTSGEGSPGTSGTSGEGSPGTSGTSGEGSPGSSGTSGEGSPGSSGTSGEGSPGTSGTSGEGSPGSSGTSGEGSPGSSGTSGEGSPGTSGTSGEGSPNAYLYIAYASDDIGTDFSLSPGASLTYIAALSTDTEIVTPQTSDFAGLWRKYVGEDGTPADLTHYCYIAWRDAPGVGFTLIPNTTLAYEAILITHTELTSPVEDDFTGYWRERLTPVVIHQIPAGGTFGQVLTKSSEDDFDTSWQTPSGGGGGDSYEYWKLKGGKVPKYGLLYNWYFAIDPRIASSEEWFAPTRTHWIDLRNIYGTETTAGVHIKEAGIEFWYGLNTGDNSSGFTARGGGNRRVGFWNIKSNGLFLGTSTTGENVCQVGLNDTTSAMTIYNSQPKYFGSSIRLLRNCTPEELLLPNGTPCAPYVGNDGKFYTTVKNGTKVWLSVNLAETKFNDGSWIPGFDGGVYTPIDDAAWAALTTGALCAYDNDWDNVFMQNDVNINSHDIVTFKDSGSVEFSITENEDGEKEITAEAIGGGAATFLDLTDTPSTYVGQAGKTVQVNSGETGLEWGSGGGGGVISRSMTYTELAAAILAGTLNRGETINISDYQTVHTIPETTDTNTGDIEPLLVTAISNNELKPEAYSVNFPDDIIYYSPDNDQSMVPGCTKGYIYRRIDTKQANDFPFDFRQAKFRRWQIDVPNWSSATGYSKMSVVKRPTGTAEQQLEIYISLVNSNTNHVVTDSDYWRRFEFDNLTYISPTKTAWNRSMDYTFIIPCSLLYQDYHFFAGGNYTTCFSNKLESPDSNLIVQTNTVVFGSNFFSNNIGANFFSNSIGSDFFSNNIGTNFIYNSTSINFYSNVIRSNFQSNSVGGSFFYNTIETNFYSNSVGADFKYNNIGANFKSNIIETNFYYNSVGADFYHNSTGTNFYSNVIGDDFYYNSVGYNFKFNSIGANFRQNTIANNFNNVIGSVVSVDFSAASHVYALYTCTIFTRADGTHRLKYCNNDDVELIVAANS